MRKSKWFTKNNYYKNVQVNDIHILPKSMFSSPKDFDCCLGKNNNEEFHIVMF